jgi:hypothetical protein
MLAQLEKTLNVAFVWLVPRVRLVGKNVNPVTSQIILKIQGAYWQLLLADTEHTIISSQMKLKMLKSSFPGDILTRISLATLEMLVLSPILGVRV